jgi:hypothetical protein
LLFLLGRLLIVFVLVWVLITWECLRGIINTSSDITRTPTFSTAIRIFAPLKERRQNTFTATDSARGQRKSFSLLSFFHLNCFCYKHKSYFPMYRRWLRSLLITIPFSCLQPSIRQDTTVWLAGHYDSTVLVTSAPSLARTRAHLAARVALWSVLFILPFLLFSPLKVASLCSVLTF